MKKAFLAAILLGAISSCQFGSKKEPVREIEGEPVPKYVEYEVKKIDEKSGPCATNEASKQCVEFNIEYPVITGMVPDEVSQKINQDIQNEIFSFVMMGDSQAETFEVLMNDLGTSYDSLIKEFEDYESSWLVEVNGDILYQAPEFISIATTIFTYTGGAHPNGQQIYRSYNLKTGEPITLDQVMIDGYEENLNESAEIEFRMLKKIPPSRSLEEEGYWFEDGEFRLNNNFAIINKSLIFYFNAYEIGPYSLGPTELELKLTDYVKLLNKNGVLGNLVGEE
ncbi:uncharacterized protein DUF3298 [Roseivirga pacifica]|uniref:DUF3298 domain-containing protein n=1 Tax=Roseivirga pacifica TaxID=1267423 RepID=A0A1I0MNU9_9BACT|nr:DUF3298 and DUF4163 domain-containing protein [Roseivirga pacifica]RKQ50550.1 uncharacterized protein DUF3298 [Roseivirga pacifica]SEV89830.1 Protein of unknown function [Roseivirga pacifica]